MGHFEDRLMDTLRAKGLAIESSSVEIGSIVRRARGRRALMAIASMASVGVVLLVGVKALPTVGRDNGGGFAASTSPSPPYPGAPIEIDDGSDMKLECPGFARRCLPFASGSRNGKEWALFMFRASNEKGKAWCQGEFFDRDFGGGCPARLPDGAKRHYVAGGRYSVSSAEEDIVDGRVDPDVDRVEIHLNGYEPFDVPVIQGPNVHGGEQPKVNYFIAFVPSDARGEIIVFDATGRKLEARAIPNLGLMLLRHTL